MTPAARADLYGFFSRLFVRELDAPFAEVLQGVGELLPSFSASDERALVLSADARAAVFDADFAHITVVHLTPYESFFVRDDAKIEAGLDNPLVRFYRAHGYEVDLGAARVLSPDHLGVELEFLSVLARSEHTAEGEYRIRLGEVQRQFVAEHLGAWAPVYLLAVQRNARTVLYREGARAALEWILTDLGGVA